MKMESELSSEVGAAGRLFNSCINLYWALIQRISALNYKKQQKQALRTEFGRLYFWGDGFYPYEGRLDYILANSSRLRNRILSILVEIGEILCKDRTGLYGIVSQALDDERLRDQRQEVSALVEGIRETLDDAVSSGSESDSGSEVSDQGNLLQTLIYDLRARNQCLIDLTGSLERPAADADLVEEVQVTLPVTSEVSGPAEIWTRKVLDTFSKVDATLAQRLGAANWQRYQRVSEQIEQAEPFNKTDDEGDDADDNSDDEDDDELGNLPGFTKTTKSSADPSSIFSSLGRKSATTGTSVSNSNFDYEFPRIGRQRMVKDLRSQATFTSVVSNDQGERGWLKIPSIPKGATQGKAFRCTVCGERQTDIINWIEWKKHVFADLQPYICTFANCRDKLKSYTTRKAWADHEFSVHRKDKVWICSDCSAQFSKKSDMREHAYSGHGYVLMQNQLEALVNAAERSINVTENSECPFCSEVPGVKSRAFAMHVGKHMEEIALAVLPRDSEFEEDRGSIASNDSANFDLAEDEKDEPETMKAGLRAGLPRSWKLKRSNSGRLHCIDPNGHARSSVLPDLTQNDWELEFCRAVLEELLKTKYNVHGEQRDSLQRVLDQLNGGFYLNAEECHIAMLAVSLSSDHRGTNADKNYRRHLDDHWQHKDSWLRLNGAPMSAQDSMNPLKSFEEETKKTGPRLPGRYMNLEQFWFLSVIGKGNFAKIMLGRNKVDEQLYAVKILKKSFVIEKDEVQSLSIEKNLYVKANEAHHPFIPHLISTFQTHTRVYFVLEYIPGGDLMHHVQQARFPISRARFYAAEVCLVLKFVHESAFIFRDLKLDNIMLALDGHIKVIDFGLAKEGVYGPYVTTKTFVGTPEFMAPEILLDKEYGRAVDWWAFGVLLYQMLLHQSPFRGKDEDEIYDAILSKEPLYPIATPRPAVSIMQKLLDRSPEFRLGYHQGAEEIMKDRFFEGIDWDALYRKEVTPPFLPTIAAEDDVRNFDDEFTTATPALTPVWKALSPEMQAEFNGFSLNNDW